MRIGVPKEIKNHEYRVGLTPASVAELVHAGHEVLVETKAGTGIDFDDEAYVRVGAKIAPDAAAVFAGSDMIVKVKEPQPRRSRCSSRATSSSPISTWPPTSPRPRASWPRARRASPMRR